MLAGGFGGTGGGSNRVDPQLQPLLGVAPLGPIPLSNDRVVQLRMLESSYKHLPQLSDSERVSCCRVAAGGEGKPWLHHCTEQLVHVFAECMIVN